MVFTSSVFLSALMRSFVACSLAIVTVSSALKPEISEED
jgi:hypothetical protein